MSQPAPKAQPPSDAILLARIAIGDQDAMVELQRRWYPQFFALAKRWLNSAAEAEDIALEAVLNVFAKAAKFRPARTTDPAGPWLRTILRNMLVDRKRKDAVRRALPIGADRDDGSHGIDPEFRAPTVQEILEATEKSASVQATLAELTDEEREVIVLRYYEDLKPEAIARELEIPVGTVNTRLFRARSRLGAMLETRWPSLFRSYGS